MLNFKSYSTPKDLLSMLCLLYAFALCPMQSSTTCYCVEQLRRIFFIVSHLKSPLTYVKALTVCMVLKVVKIVSPLFTYHDYLLTVTHRDSIISLLRQQLSVTFINHTSYSLTNRLCLSP
jgi:hypothetical protein